LSGKGKKKDERRAVKVINMENPGSHIITNHNGTRYEIEDRATVKLPGGVIAALKDTVVTKHTVSGEQGKGHKTTLSRRFEIIELDKPELSDTSTVEQKEREKIAEAINA
jgi:hypothetical protein